MKGPTSSPVRCSLGFSAVLLLTACGPTPVTVPPPSPPPTSVVIVQQPAVPPQPASYWVRKKPKAHVFHPGVGGLHVTVIAPTPPHRRHTS